MPQAQALLENSVRIAELELSMIEPGLVSTQVEEITPSALSSLNRAARLIASGDLSPDELICSCSSASTD
jgi:hypothetical protein